MEGSLWRILDSVRAGAAAIIWSPSGITSSFAVRLEFPGTTNNVAEYEAVLLGLRKLKALGVRRAVLLSDSQVISDHIGGDATAKQETLQKYLKAIRRIENAFEGFTVKKIPRVENEEADTLP